MSDVNFEDNSIEVMSTIEQICIAALHEVAGELTSQVKRNTAVGKVDGGDTKNSWQYVVNEAKHEAVVGNPKENAIWEEYGTGEYAAKGNGRKGGWFIPIGNGKGEIPEKTVEAYGFKVIKGEDGKSFAYTKGKEPKHTLEDTFNKNKNKIKKAIRNKFKEID